MQSAKKRKKEFSLTFEQFKEFAKKVNLLDGYGKTKHSYHIDRIDERKGYHIDNIQKLTNEKNVHKYKEYDRLTGKGKIYTVKSCPLNDDEVPF